MISRPKKLRGSPEKLCFNRAINFYSTLPSFFDYRKFFNTFICTELTNYFDLQLN